MGNQDLLTTIRQVRGRWKLALVLRGAVICVAAVLILLALSAIGFAQLGLSPQTVLALRITVGLLTIATIALAVLRPALRRVSDQRVALYIEENEPALQSMLISAIETPSVTENALARALVERAAAKCRDLHFGVHIERPRIKRHAVALAATVAIAALIVGAGPSSLRTSARALLLPTPEAVAAGVMFISVAPGNDTIARGADITINAELHAFASEQADVVLRDQAGQWRRWSMSRGQSDGTFEAELFDIAGPTDYYIEAGAIKSPTYHIAVVDAPFVRSLTLEYQYPAYTGLPGKRVDNAGDIAAPRGTIVRVIAQTSAAVGAGRLQLDATRSIAMQPNPAGGVQASMRVLRDGLYHVELPGIDGRFTSASAQYAITAIPDNPPTVRIEKPGRDIKVSSVDEVFVSATAEDDYGISNLELVYSVNGGPQQTKVLARPATRSPNASGAHTFFLEELSLKPGDFVSYFARGSDNNGIDGAKSNTTDIYFIQIRPFSRDYRAAEQQGAPGQGGGEEDPGALSERQRQIIAATFNISRDRQTYTAQGYAEAMTTIELSQRRLREQVTLLVQRMQQRGVVEMDSIFAQIAQLLPQALSEMSSAEQQLANKQPDNALPPEQRALQQLLRAEALYRDVQVQMQQQAQGGGGNGAPTAEDLADLFELERDQLRNQYETVQRSREEQTQRQVDDVLERLRELARRQQQEAERQRQAAAQQQQGGSGTGSGQRRLADEAEQAARQLERLAREQSNPQLADAARRLQEAANAMRNASTQRSGRGLAEANAARERIDEARRRLQQNQRESLQGSVDEARQRADQLREQQRAIARESDTDNPDQRRLSGQRQQLDQGVAELEQQLDRMSAQTRGSNREAARQLQEAADGIRSSKLRERIRAQAQGAQYRSRDYNRAQEEQIGRDLDRTSQQLAQASGAAGRQSGQSQSRDAADRARQLAQAAEGMRDRARETQETQMGASTPTGPSRGGGNDRNRMPIRQLQSEARERAGEISALGRQLREAGVDPQQLQGALDALRLLQTNAPYNDPEEIDRLLAQVARGLRNMEFDLRQRVDEDQLQKLYMASPGSVPAEYRKAVEEYYRSLARKKQ